ncbi:MAG: hypothetical protein WCE44_08695 [Candidatus Velthaea sp.]|jgi:hypothetical protein
MSVLEFAVTLAMGTSLSPAAAIAFYPNVEIPTEAAGHAAVFLPIWLQKSSGPWTAFGGGGLFLNPGPGNRQIRARTQAAAECD